MKLNLTLKVTMMVWLFFFITIHLTPNNVNAKITIKAVGDIMMGSVTPKPVLPKDADFVKLDPVIEMCQGAQILFGNLEGIFITEDIKPVKCSEESRKARRCYEFGMPMELLDVLRKFHFKVLNLDNNHTADYGEQGYLFTKDVLSNIGIHPIPKGDHTVLKIGGKSIAFVGFGFTTNSNHVSNINGAKTIIQQLKEKNHLVFVSFHGGAEGADANHVYNEVEMYYNENRGNLVAFSHAVIDAGADLVIGHGPHVLRALELYKNKLIAYSLGNFYTYGQFKLRNSTEIGAILEIELSDTTGQFVKGIIHSTKQLSWGIPIPDKENTAIQIIKDLTQEDFPDTQLIIHDDGRILRKK